MGAIIDYEFALLMIDPINHGQSRNTTKTSRPKMGSEPNDGQRQAKYGDDIA